MASIISNLFNVINPYSLVLVIFVAIMIGLVIYFLIDNFKEKQIYRCEIGDSEGK